MAQGALAQWEENFCLPFYRHGWKDSNTVYLDSQTFYAGCAVGGAAENLRGIYATSCGTPWAGLNLGFVAEPVRRVSALGERIERASQFYRRCCLPWILVVPDKWVAPGLHPAVEEFLQEGGFQLAMEGEAISADRLKPLGCAPLEVAPVDSPESWTAVAAINAAAWNVPVEWILPLLGSTQFQAEARGWLGRVNGKAVSSVVTFPRLSYTISAWNATLPAYQRRGFGDYMMRYGAAHAEENRPMFAISSPQALRTWLGAGFEQRQDRFRLYMAPV